MGDDSWSDDGQEVESTYRTISSLRELVGPPERRHLREDSLDEQCPVSLKGTRIGKARCSEDPGYFVSTPLERFKLTKQSKLEAKRRLQKKNGPCEDGFDSNRPSPFRTMTFESPENNPSDPSSFDNHNFHQSNMNSSNGKNNNVVPKYDPTPVSNETDDSLELSSDERNSNSKSERKGANRSSASPVKIAKVRDGAKKEPFDRPTRKSSIKSDSTTKYPSPDRFTVSKTVDDVCERPSRSTGSKSNTNSSSERFTVSNPGADERSNEKTDSSSRTHPKKDPVSNSTCTIKSSQTNKNSSNSPIKKSDEERLKVSNPKDYFLDLPPFFKDLSNLDASSPYRDLSPSFRDLSCGPPRRRLSQCPEEDENENDEEPTKRPILPRLHMDKLFFDSSLVDIKSPASSSSTIDTIGSTEEVWVKRMEPRTRQDVGGGGDGSSTDGGSTMSSTTSRGSNSDSSHSYRSESTWGGGNPGRQMVALVTGRRHRSGGRHSVYHTVTGAVGGTGPPRVQQTHIPSIFEVFRPRSKSDANANQKKPTLMGHVRNAMGGSGGKGGSVGDEALPSTSGSGSRGPVAKVIHLFRNRSQSAASADEKRKARAAALQQQQQQYAASVIRRSSLDKRRLSLGTVAGGSHRGSDPALDPNHAAILFRDSRGLPVADPFLEKVNLSDLEEDESQIFVKFFRFHKCYDLIPTSAKLVVFDTQLLVKKAFFALVYNGVRAAPLWDSIQHKFVGMLTITDFIKILKMYYGKTNGPEWMHEFESHKLDTWRKVLKDEVRELVSIGPDASLYEAISILVQHRIHRLPVVDQETNNVLYILTHKRILRFLFLYINDLPRPSFMSKTLAELRVGTFQDVATAKQETTIISALDVFMDRRVSALPIVDEDNKLVDIYAKFDVINLAAEKTYDNLDVSLKEANDHRNEWFEGVHKCSMDDTLYTIIERIVRAEVHRLVVTDDEERVIGVVSLSDILDYLVLKPAREDLACRSESPSMSESLAYSNTQEDTIAEGEEEEERERSPTQTWTQPQWSVTPAAPLTSA